MGKHPKNDKHFTEEISLEHKIKMVHEAHRENSNLQNKLITENKISSETANRWSGIVAKQFLDFLEILNNNDHPRYIETNKYLLEITKNLGKSIPNFEIDKFLHFLLHHDQEET